MPLTEALDESREDPGSWLDLVDLDGLEPGGTDLSAARGDDPATTVAAFVIATQIALMTCLAMGSAGPWRLYWFALAGLGAAALGWITTRSG